MNIAEIAKNKKLVVAGGIAAAVVVAGIVWAGAKRVLDPTRTPMPDKAAPIAAIEPELDKLKPVDRQLVIGYLLLQRGEISSLSTRGISFTAKTFGEAIAAQQALLAAKQVSPEWPLMRALEDQALRPLRQAVSIQLIGRQQAVMGDLFKANTSAVIIATGGSPDAPRTVMIYRIANAGNVPIKHLNGYIQPQIASDDWVNLLTHNASACHVDLSNLAPGAGVTVICAQADLDTIGDASKTPDANLFIDWRPELVEYPDGSKMAYDINALTSTLLWNRYNIDGDIKQ
jgi:hypothetical protein